MPGSTIARSPGPTERSWTSDLAFPVYRELSTGPGNVFLSPYGLLGALMVLRAAGAGATRREIERALHRRETGEVLTRAFSGLLRAVGHLARPGSGLVEIATANALWCPPGCPMRPSFVESLRERFGAEAGEADFAGSPAEAARTINAWGGEATRGRVRHLLDEDEAATLRHGLLANVVSFTGPWLEPFGDDATWPEPFTASPGSSRDVPMLHGVGTHPYARAGRVEALHVPYAVSRIRMIVLLPEEGHLADVEADLGAELLHEVIDAAEPRLSHVALPRCRVEGPARLRRALESLGITRAFGPAADFTRASEKDGVFIDDVLHHGFVEVDEYGTESARSPGALSSARREPHRDGALHFQVDRPFLFLICDVETETLFFIGRVLDPRG